MITGTRREEDKREPVAFADEAALDVAEADWTDMLAQLAERQERIADQQARDAWMLEALAEKIDQLSRLVEGRAQTGPATEMSDAAPAALGAMAERLEQVATSVAALVDAVDQDRETLKQEVAEVARGVFSAQLETYGAKAAAEAEARETRLADAAGDRLVARADNFVRGPAEVVAKVVGGTVESLGGDIADAIDAKTRAVVEALAPRLDAIAAAAEREVDFTPVFDAHERAERRRAAALSGRLEAGLEGLGATSAATAARIDTIFDRLTALDARSEASADAAATADDIAEILSDRLVARVAERVAATLDQTTERLDAAAQGALREAVAADLSDALDAAAQRTGDALRGELKVTLTDEVATALAPKLRAEVASQITYQVTDKVRRETRANFAEIRAELTSYATELSAFRTALDGLKPLEASAAKLDALIGRLAAEPDAEPSPNAAQPLTAAALASADYAPLRRSAGSEPRADRAGAQDAIVEERAGEG